MFSWGSGQDSEHPQGVGQFSSVAQVCHILCDPMDRSTPGFPVHHQLPGLTQTHVHPVHGAIQPSQPLSSPSPPASIFPSIKIFSSESVLCIRWSNYWNFNFSTSPSNEYSGLISFRMDWLDLLAVPGTLKSLLQHYFSKASRCGTVWNIKWYFSNAWGIPGKKSLAPQECGTMAWGGRVGEGGRGRGFWLKVGLSSGPQKEVLHRLAPASLLL